MIVSGCFPVVSPCSSSVLLGLRWSATPARCSEMSSWIDTSSRSCASGSPRPETTSATTTTPRLQTGKRLIQGKRGGGEESNTLHDELRATVWIPGFANQSVRRSKPQPGRRVNRRRANMPPGCAQLAVVSAYSRLTCESPFPPEATREEQPRWACWVRGASSPGSTRVCGTCA